MPEGPEVSYLADIIGKHIKNKILRTIHIKSKRYPNINKFKNSLPLKCINVDKKGKVIFIYFENNWCMICKLGMTGWFNIDHKLSEYSNIHAIFEFSKNTVLTFVDQLKFGVISFINDMNYVKYQIERLAPDILNPETTFKTLIDRINLLSNKRLDNYLENVIIDQRLILSGIGNYLKAEILYDAKISPFRRLKDMNINDWKCLFKSAKIITKKMNKLLYQLDDDAYFNQMKIYRKKLDPFGNKVSISKTIIGRTTYYVKSIQK